MPSLLSALEPAAIDLLVFVNWRADPKSPFSQMKPQLAVGFAPPLPEPPKGVVNERPVK